MTVSQDKSSFDAVVSHLEFTANAMEVDPHPFPCSPFMT